MKPTYEDLVSDPEGYLMRHSERTYLGNGYDESMRLRRSRVSYAQIHGSAFIKRRTGSLVNHLRDKGAGNACCLRKMGQNAARHCGVFNLAGNWSR
ncbi:TPA: hypothetical protein ACNOH9_001906 [Citrobacter freundii]